MASAQSSEFGGNALGEGLGMLCVNPVTFRTRLMLSLACFVAVGLVLGFLMPLRAFALFSLFALAAYAALTVGFSGLGSAYDAIFAWIALQVGYFLAVLIYVARPRLLEPADPETPVDPKIKQPESNETSPRDPHSPRPR
jgi:hypothetical protein